MQANINLFQSVFIRYIESFTPHFHKIIQEFDKQSSKSDEQSFRNTVIRQIFKKFPRENTQYINIIKALSKLSSFDQETVVSYLSKMVLDLLNHNQNSPFRLLQTMSPIMKQQDISYREIIFHFGIYFLSDLLVEILQSGYNGSIDLLCACGTKICQSHFANRFIDNTVLHQWSVIFSILSEFDIKPIIKMFEVSIDLQEYESSFFLIQYIRLDLMTEENNLYFLTKIHDILNHLKQSNRLTNDILMATSNLFQSQKIYRQCIDSILDFYFSLKDLSEFADAAIENICILYKLYPSKTEEINNFYKQNVFINLSDRSKIEQKSYLFQNLIYGNQIDIRWLYRSWTITTRVNSFSYLKWNSNSSISFQTIFLEIFFPVCDFSACYKNFSDLLLHFAALNFNNFMDQVVPCFMKLDLNDPRLVSFFLTISKINTPAFIDFASTKVTFSDLNTFNEKVKPKIFECIQLFTSDFLAKHFYRIDLYEEIIAKSDFKIEKKFSNHKNKNLIDHSIIEYDENDYLNLISICKVLPYVFSADDDTSPEMLKLVLQLSFNFIDSISSVGYQICESILQDSSIANRFITTILEYLDSCKSCSALLTCIRLLNEMPESLPIAVLHQIEFFAIQGLSSIHPSIRIISIKLLQLANSRLNESGLYNYIIGNIDIIQQVVNFRLNSSQLLKFHVVCYSHFYDIWLYYLCEIANIIVQFNYLPLLNQFSLNKCSAHHMKDGILIFYNASQYNLKNLNKVNNQYKGTLFAKFVPHFNKAKIVFDDNILIHSHATLYPLLIDYFCNHHNPEQFLHILKQIIESNRITQTFAKVLWHYCYKYLAFICEFFLQEQINDKVLIDLNEIHIIQNVDSCIDFCLIIKTCLKKINGSISIDDWPITSREIVFRFLLNWMTTKSLKLTNLRIESQNTLIPLIHVGPLTCNIEFFNSKTLDILIEIEKKSSILSFLLYFHVQLLLDLFIDYLYTAQSSNSDLVLSALFMAFDAEYSAFLCSRSAPLLLLGFFLQIHGHTRSAEFLSAIIDLITKGENSIEKIQAKCGSAINKDQSILFSPINTLLRHSNDLLSFSAMSRSNSSNSINNYILTNVQKLSQILPKALSKIQPLVKKNDSMNFTNLIQNSEFNNDSSSIELLNEIAKDFSIQTELIFQYAFNLLEKENLRIPIKDVVDILNIWSINIHFDPRQRLLMKNSIHIYTPYSFLNSLLNVTDVIGKSSFAAIISLWVTLMKSQPDFLYEFLFHCPCCNSIKQILLHLTYVDPVSVINQVSQRCSFAYYYFVLSQNRPFEAELWFIPFLTEAFKVTKSINLIPYIVHFAFMFVDMGTVELLQVICNAMNIEFLDCILSLDMIVSIVKRLVYKLNKKQRVLKNKKTKNLTQLTFSGKKHYLNETIFEKDKPKYEDNHKSVDFIGIWGTEAIKWLIGSKNLRLATLSMVIFNQLLKPIDKTVINGICQAIIYHIYNNSQEISKVIPLIQESLVFYNSVFDGNEQFCFQYASSFLNCRIFVEACLDKAIKLFMKCLLSPETKTQTQKVIMDIVRILVNKLESDENSQMMFEFILKTQFNEELLMIALAICHSNQVINNPHYSSISFKAKKADEMNQSSLIRTTFQIFEKFLNTGSSSLKTLTGQYNFDKTIDNGDLIENSDNKSVIQSFDDLNEKSSISRNENSISDITMTLFNDDKSIHLIRSTANEICAEGQQAKVVFRSIHFPTNLLQAIIEKVDELALYHTLIFYSVMLHSSSNQLMNSIFLISSLIAHKITKKNQASLEIVYQFALRNLSNCQYAIDFISSIDTILFPCDELYDCERSIENVCQSLNAILTNTEKKFVIATDLDSIESVVNLLNNLIVPKIFPFYTRQKFVEKMKRLDNQIDSLSDFVSIQSESIRRSNSDSSLLSMKTNASIRKVSSWSNDYRYSIYDCRQ